MCRPLVVACVMVLPACLLATGSLEARPVAQDSIRYVSTIADNNLIGAAITNVGYVGNNFSSRTASLEYPAHSGAEHLTHGGLWIGAHALDDVGMFTGVTTAALDGFLGSSPFGQTEFTPAGNSILRRSSLPASPDFDPQAVSELDLISSYSDQPPRSTSGNPELHRPLNVLVRQANYCWSFGDYAHVLFFHYVIRNLGPPLSDVWVGMYTEFASGNKNAYFCWPPTSTCGPGSWFRKKWIQYDDSLRLVREHYCLGQPVPSGCSLGSVPYWIGLQLLTPPSVGQQVTLAAWPYGPGDPSRDQDVERYAIMSAGTIQDLSTPDLQPQTGDPVELLALGPFPMIESGDSVSVDFAIVGGAEIADLRQHARTAQQAYDVPTPVQLSLASARAESGHVRLVWYAPGAGISVAQVYRCEPAGEWRSAGDAIPDGSGNLVYDDFSVTAGRRYGYRVGLPSAVREILLGEVWVDVPERATFALHGIRPNPASGRDLAVSFSLASAEPVNVALLDIAGRTVLARDLGAVGPGEHRIRLSSEGALPPGVYLVCLSQGGRSVSTRAIVTP